MRKAQLGVADRIRGLARNLWWSWQPDAQRLFASMDPALWDATHHNPIRTLKLLTPERRELLEREELFIAHLERVEKALADELKRRTWFERTYRGRSKPLIAYFCAEFAVHESLPQYSGGLGVLAGDHLKSASDLGLPLVGVGLLYRSGYYTQDFNADGSTKVIYPRIDFAECPITDTGKTIAVPMAGKRLFARIWLQQVGRTKVVLLSSDVRENRGADRRLTDHLYGGDRETRIRQETLLGVGGVMALEALGIQPTVYHLNEGHAGFCAIERLVRMMGSGESWDEAVEAVQRSTVFTTHTPVPAGNERFAPKLAWKYLKDAAGKLGLDQQQMMALGREDAANRKEEFCMTVLALRLSDHCNGVAELHGETSRKMWKRVYGVDHAKQVPIGHVTNGVHPDTWLAPEMRSVYDKYIGYSKFEPTPEWTIAAAAKRVPDEGLWAARLLLKRRMIEFLRLRLARRAVRQHAGNDRTIAAMEALDENALTIGFARRFATYKRATLIFSDLKRLARIVNDPERPVQIIFAGKAHPADVGGQAFAQKIFAFSQRAEFRGKIVIIDDYDMELGRMLTSGCDVWLNNPRRPQEASGTSGMKPPLHGGINCSVLDGWWPEAYNGKNGWAIGDESESANERKQDRGDAAALYELLEQRIVPEYYARDRAGLPKKWIGRMKASIATVCGPFNTHRMVGEYWRKYYLPAHGG